MALEDKTPAYPASAGYQGVPLSEPSEKHPREVSRLSSAVPVALRGPRKKFDRIAADPASSYSATAEVEEEESAAGLTSSSSVHLHASDLVTASQPASGVDDFIAVAHTTFDLTAEGFTDTDPITTLTDQTGNGHDATQGDGTRQPSAQTVGAMQVARFDGTDFLRTALFSAPLPQPNTVVVLGKYDDNDTNNHYLFGGVSGLARHVIGTFSGVWKYYAGSSNIGSTTDDADWHVFVCVFNGASSALYLDGGVAIASGDPGSHELTGITVGGIFLTSDTWDGDGNFWGLYDGDLRTDDLDLLNALGAELADRAAITWTPIT